MSSLVLLVPLSLLLLFVLNTPTLADTFTSPVGPCAAGRWISVPGQDYMYETYHIAWKVSEQGFGGYCWYVDGDTISDTELARYCAAIAWIDDTAECRRGPAPLGAAALFQMVWLPVVIK